MPSWNDSESSSEELLFSGESSVNLDVPEPLHDPDFSGIEESEASCDHLEKLMKYVAFQGVNTGRRYLGCGRTGGDICSTVRWLDPEWPDHLKKCLVALWEMYESESSGRLSDACVHAEKYYKVIQEKREFEEKNRILLADLSKALNGSQVADNSQVAAISQHVLDLNKLLREKAEKHRDELKEEKKNMEAYIADLLKGGELKQEKLLREKAENERDVMKEEKKKYEYYIADLLKAGEVNKEKLKQIKQILDQ